jgi:hypothetical protein
MQQEATPVNNLAGRWIPSEVGNRPTKESHVMATHSATGADSGGIVAYVISGGLAKAGSRQRYTSDDTDLDPHLNAMVRIHAG